jgi:hypothetical protein
LELYKSLDGKISLLDEAIKLGDGDALITVGYDALCLVAIFIKIYFS